MKMWPFRNRPGRTLQLAEPYPTSARYEQVAAEARAGGWSPVQWKLIWLADGFSLGRRGIRPRFRVPDADEAWDTFMVDPALQHNPRDFQRVVLACLVADGEAFVQLVGGKFMPVPAPFKINYGDNNIPIDYVWQTPEAKTVPADEMLHLFIRVRPGQKRGDCLFLPISDIAEERLQYIKAIIKLGKMAARLWLFQKRRGGSEITSGETTANSPEARPEVAKIDFTKDGITQIGPQDDVVAPGVSGQPLAPSEVDKSIGTTMAMPYGISRMQLMGDFSDTNYSSARFADLTDHSVWMRYQDLLLRLMKKVYEAWPDRALHESNFVTWHLPTFPHTDPVRWANMNQILINNKLKSPQEVIMEDDRDPETTFRLIEEFQARFEGGGEGVISDRST